MRHDQHAAVAFLLQRLRASSCAPAPTRPRSASELVMIQSFGRVQQGAQRCRQRRRQRRHAAPVGGHRGRPRRRPRASRRPSVRARSRRARSALRCPPARPGRATASRFSESLRAGSRGLRMVALRVVDAMARQRRAAALAQHGDRHAGAASARYGRRRRRWRWATRRPPARSRPGRASAALQAALDRPAEKSRAAAARTASRPSAATALRQRARPGRADG